VKGNNDEVLAVVPNGIDSTNGHAVLYIYDVTDGSQIAKIDTGVGGSNGLSSPRAADMNADGKADYIYAGDLRGNVWKFDVSDKNSSRWEVAFRQGNTPKPLFTAKDGLNNPQPITAQITVAVNDVNTDPNYGERFVFFGTGSYFRAGDPNDTQVQSWYGLIDDDRQISGRGDLKQRTILSEGTFDGKSVRVFSEASTNDMKGKSGWYLDFTTQAGERIVTASKLYRLAEPTLIASSIIPVVDPCVPGGKGFVNALNPYTGTGLLQGFLDINDNGSFSDDTLNGDFIGGVDLGVGMAGEPVLVGNRLVAGGSSGEKQDIVVNLGTPPRKGRISWREIVAE
jgi:type IV pilus assembly protein PilY1